VLGTKGGREGGGGVLKAKGGREGGAGGVEEC
jgi:hypothetical protein